MAFSFRAGTNWCHDFPKLARESGFYFNNHTSRVRVDWNRISLIDIERVIRERDFHTIDENVNYVIDYYLESEYDVKILDPNFVKLFRLAQLAVEYLLYCKQYLDQSVVILKEELKYKIEENVKLKDEVSQLQNSIKEIKEKLKDKNKSVEIKSDAHGEIHKCPYCPKTFVSASFANAHLVRRHSNLQDVMMSNSSPAAHEEYRAETEKLHNEIKTLKERLNQTERVIRSETSKICLEQDVDSYQRDDQYRRYQEEIKNLKTLLFTEIRNIQRKEASINNQQEKDVDHENVKELISQQENEIQRLRNQLQEQLKTNANEVQEKLTKQEDYWKSKIDQVVSQHRSDIENLFAQLRQTQESANRTKSEYEEKVAFLEQQSADQSKLLNVQSEQLSNITRDILDAQNQTKLMQKPIESNNVGKAVHKQKIESHTDTMDSESSQNVKVSQRRKTVQSISKQASSLLKTNQSYNKLVSSKKADEHRQVKRREEVTVTVPKVTKRDEKKSYQEKSKPKSLMNLSNSAMNRNKYSSLDESKNATSTGSESEESESEGETEDETSESSATHTQTTDDEEPSEPDEKITKHDTRTKRRSSNASLESIKQEMQQVFEAKLKELGIDPEWTGIPEATFKQKIETIKHQQNLASKRYPKYESIRRKILEELSKRVSISQKSTKKVEYEKKSFLNKAMKNVKTKALKALHEFKVPKGNETSTPILSSKSSTPRESQPKRKLSLELLPKKPTQLDLQKIMRQAELELEKKQKKEEPVLLRPKSSLLREDSIRQQVAETVAEATQKPKQRSYQSIEEFMRDIDETPKLDMTSTKVTSTPSKKENNLLQDSYTFANDSDQSSKQDAAWALASPKNNKSVLKSTPGVGSVKKKVLFDLEKEKSPEKDDADIKSIEEFVLEEPDDKKEGNDSDWFTSSISEEKEPTPVKETKTGTESIQLKTSQSDRIAEISRKIQEKLEASRRKPAGSIEAMFSVKTPDEHAGVTSTADPVTSILDHSSSHIESQSNPNQVPRPAPRKQLVETKGSDLDVEELLAVLRQKRSQKLAI